MIEIPFVEFYQGLPEKVVQGYHWVLTHMPHVEWLVKADDDMFVRVKPMENYLRKYNPHTPIVIGHINPRSAVLRSGKWAESVYPLSIYPYWPQGSMGHIVSRRVAQYLTDHSSELHRYQGEDVSIGIWLDEAISHPKDPLPKVEYIHVPYLVTNQGVAMCDDTDYFMIGHDLTADQQQQCMDWGDDDVPIPDAWLDRNAQFPQRLNRRSHHHHHHQHHASVPSSPSSFP